MTHNDWARYTPLRYSSSVCDYRLRAASGRSMIILRQILIKKDYKRNFQLRRFDWHFMIIGINALSTQTQISKIIRKHCSARRGLSQYTKLFRFMLMKNCVTRLDQYFEFMVNTLHDPCGIVGLQYFRKFYWVPWKQQPSVPLSWAARMRSGTTGSAPAPSPIQQPGEILDLFREAECI